jgi:hypothetical protein
MIEIASKQVNTSSMKKAHSLKKMNQAIAPNLNNNAAVIN